MSANRVAVVDYGIGNLYSVQRALETCGADVDMVSDAGGIDSAPRLVLPGVGAFSKGMQGLQERGLIDALRRYAGTGRPLLGICLGMQMLATVSEEFGLHEGLGLIPGRVVAIPSTTANGKSHKIPHISWSPLSPAGGASWDGTILHDTPTGTAVYLVHSYHVMPEDSVHLLAQCDYGGRPITAAVRRGRVFGCQFHPEKSGRSGLQILATFLRL